jgi:hypothetical protein
MIPNETLSYIAGFVAMVFVILAYFVKKKEMYLVYQSLCIMGLVFSYLFNAQFFAMIGLFISLCRALTFFLIERKGKKASIALSFLFAGLTVASYFIVNFWILGDAQPLDILCLASACMYAFIFRIRDLKTVRFTMLVPTVISIAYNVFSGAALFVTLSYAFELVANVVSIFKYHIIKR